MPNTTNHEALNDWITRQRLTAPDATLEALFLRYAKEQGFDDVEWLSLLMLASDLVSQREARGATVCG